MLIDSCVAGIPGDELCDTQLDEDCDGAVDESDAIDATDWFPDVDGDGFGNDQSVLRSCTSPLGHVADGPDCDDLDPLVWSTPDEVPGLRFIDGERLGWSLPEESGGVAPVTEILRASSGTGFDDVSKVCVEVQSRITVVLPDVPPTGQAWYYLVRMTTTCPDGVGPLGTDSAGAARTASACVD